MPWSQTQFLRLASLHSCLLHHMCILLIFMLVCEVNIYECPAEGCPSPTVAVLILPMQSASAHLFHTWPHENTELTVPQLSLVRSTRNAATAGTLHYVLFTVLTAMPLMKAILILSAIYTKWCCCTWASSAALTFISLCATVTLAVGLPFTRITASSSSRSPKHCIPATHKVMVCFTQQEAAWLPQRQQHDYSTDKLCAVDLHVEHDQMQHNPHTLA